MAMLINGTSLPDFPEGVFDEKTYGCILHMLTTDGESYAIVAASAPAIAVPIEITGETDEMLINMMPYMITWPNAVATTYMYQCGASTDWEMGEENVSEGLEIPMISYLGMVYEIVWTNHTILIATEVDDAGNYVIGDEIYFQDITYKGPDRVAVDGEFMVRIADFCRTMVGVRKRFQIGGMEEIVTAPDNYTWQNTVAKSVANPDLLFMLTTTINAEVIDPFPLTFYMMMGPVNLPNAKKIGRAAFSTCFMMSKVIAPNLEEVGIQTFNACGNLETADFPLLKKIGQEGFASTGLTAIDFPVLEHLGCGAFNGCDDLATVVLPATLTEIEGNPFYDCAALTSLTVSEDNPYFVVENNTLYTTGKETLITPPNGVAEYVVDALVKSLAPFAFYYNKTLASVTLPDGLEVIGEQAFGYCEALTDIAIPSTVTKICNYAFYYAKGLTKIDLPASVSEIESSGLSNITNLDTVIIRKSDTICVAGGTGALSGSKIASGGGYIYVPSALVETYKADNNWKTYAAQFRAIEDYPDICGAA